MPAAFPLKKWSAPLRERWPSSTVRYGYGYHLIFCRVEAAKMVIVHLLQNAQTLLRSFPVVTR